MVVVKYSSIGGKGVIVDAQENMDEGTKLINAIDLQTIDTDLYMSKELWIPFGARGAYGGQVHSVLFFF
jgi:hypothetical protein